MVSILEDMIELLVGGITRMATGIGQGLQSLVQNVFLVTGEGGAMELSTFGSVTLIFAGISLAVGLSTLIFNWLTSLGN